MSAADAANPSFASWLDGLGAGHDLPPVARGLLRIIAQHPEQASYASARALAALAGVDVSNVTRLAQAIGYGGWPELRAEVRAEYLATLSLSEIGEQRQARTRMGPSERSIDADRRALSLLRPEPAVIADVVAAFAGAGRRATAGGGTYGAVAQVLAGHATVTGYPTAFLAEGAALANGILLLGEGDVLLCLSLWRPYQSVLDALRVARSRGVVTVVVTDLAHSPVTEHAEHTILVSSEGGGYLPTMVPALAVVNLLCTDLAQRDPAFTRESLARHEEIWTDLQVLHRDS